VSQIHVQLEPRVVERVLRRASRARPQEHRQKFVAVDGLVGGKAMTANNPLTS
jgi:hypothetical protein